MVTTNPYALYIYCDAAKNYGSKGMGGIGILVRFPDSTGLADMSYSVGRYHGGSIDALEMEALIQGMKKALEIYQEYPYELANVRHVILVTDRHGLADSEKRTNPFLIKDWRRNGWKNHDDKPIKNHAIIDELDKLRTKLRNQAGARVEIQYMSRKKNRSADKLAKIGKEEGIVIRKLEKKGDKIGRRRFKGGEVVYKAFKVEDIIHVHIYKKEAVQDQWEVWGELCEGIHQGKKLKIYTDDEQAKQLNRGNEFLIKLKNVYLYYFRIYEQITKLEKNEISESMEE